MSGTSVAEVLNLQDSYYDKNSERLKAYQKAYYEKNKKRINKNHSRWYQKNKHFYNVRKDSTSSEYGKQILYSVWNNITDEVVIIDGNYRECSKAMGVSEKSFYTLVTKACQGKSKKWTIEKRKLRGTEGANEG